jgi:hypothetical protein
MQNSIEFQVETAVNALAVTPYVDGVRLPDLVKIFERESGFPVVGGYAGLVIDGFNYGPMNDYFFGHAKSDYWKELGGIYLLGCGECGDVGCWPLVCVVDQQGSDIVWSKFRQQHRAEWDYAGFGPFVFSQANYLSALEKLAADLAGMD